MTITAFGSTVSSDIWEGAAGFPGE